MFSIRDDKDEIYFDNSLIGRLSKQQGRHHDEISIKVPYALDEAKLLKNLKDYGFEFYAKIHLSQTVKKSFKEFYFDFGHVRESRIGAQSLFIYNKSIKYEKEL